MKKLNKIGATLCIVLLPFIVNAQQGGKLIIDGKIESDTMVTGKIFLQYIDNDTDTRDSAEITGNLYHFERSIHDGAIVASLFLYPTANGIRIPKSPFKGFAQFYVEPGHATVIHNTNFKITDIKGSQIELDARKVRSQERARLKADTLLYADFIAANPDSWLSFLLLEKMVKNKRIANTNAQKLYNQMSPGLKRYGRVSAINILIGAEQNIGIGKPALAFSEKDIDGKTISLADFRGKYILIDFWASWCHPCREENPFIRSAYEKYKSKGFEVFGVSLDQTRANWIKALQEDKMIWPQGSNLLGFKDEVVLKYGVTAIPRNFLIDPSGKIIAMDLRGEKLEKELGAIFTR
jgi:peroxiredoxin